MVKYFMINLQKVWGQAGIKLTTPGSDSESIALRVVQGSDQLDSLGHLIFTIGYYRILKKAMRTAP